MRFVSMLCLALLVLGCGPIVMLPGGELSGTVTPPPDDWSFTDDYRTVQLETRPSDPYSVNVWVMAAEGSVYVAAGGGRESSWAQHIAEDPRVRLRIGDAIYELRAVEADDEASRATVLAATRAKYDMSPDDDRVDDAVLYRLEPR